MVQKVKKLKKRGPVDAHRVSEKLKRFEKEMNYKPSGNNLTGRL